MKKIIDRINLFFDRKSDNPKKYSTMNEQEERELFYEEIKDSNFYLEFGSGGSTFDALKIIKNGKICSIEGSSDWIEHLKKWNFIQKNINSGKLNLVYTYIGKTGEWSTPLEDDKVKLFPNYYSILKTAYAKKADTILVDGRFRVACILNAIKYLDNNVKILVHDFTNRPHYHIVLKYCDITKNAGTLCVLKIKEHINLTELDHDILLHKYDLR